MVYIKCFKYTNRCLNERNGMKWNEPNSTIHKHLSVISLTLNNFIEHQIKRELRHARRLQTTTTKHHPINYLPFKLDNLLTFFQNLWFRYINIYIYIVGDSFYLYAHYLIPATMVIHMLAYSAQIHINYYWCSRIVTIWKRDGPIK